MFNHECIVQRLYKNRSTGSFEHKYFGGKGRWHDDPRKARLYNNHAARSVAGMFRAKAYNDMGIHDLEGLMYINDTVISLSSATTVFDTK